MKFLISHRNDILSCLAENGLSKELFSFKKKRGRIIIEENESKKWFSFYKRRDFSLILTPPKKLTSAILRSRHRLLT